MKPYGSLSLPLSRNTESVMISICEFLMMNPCSSALNHIDVPHLDYMGVFKHKCICGVLFYTTYLHLNTELWNFLIEWDIWIVKFKSHISSRVYNKDEESETYQNRQCQKCSIVVLTPCSILPTDVLKYNPAHVTLPYMCCWSLEKEEMVHLNLCILYLSYKQ